jgi:hypothetical protein
VIFLSYWIFIFYRPLVKTSWFFCATSVGTGRKPKPIIPIYLSVGGAYAIIGASEKIRNPSGIKAAL